MILGSKHKGAADIILGVEILEYGKLEGTSATQGNTGNAPPMMSL